MAQHLCIVSRDNPLLLGYLNIALGYLTRSGDELEIVIDRRPDPEVVSVPVGIEQRYLQGVDSLLRTRGYAIVSRAAGEDWHLSTAPIAFADEDVPAVAVEATKPSPLAAIQAIQEPLRRRLLLAVGAGCVLIVAASFAIQSDALGRVAGAAGGAVAWLRSTPAREQSVPASAPTPAPTVASPLPPAGPPKAALEEPARTAHVAPARGSVNGSPRAPIAPEPAAQKTSAVAAPAPPPPAKPAPPPAQAQTPPAVQHVEPAHAVPTPKPTLKAEAKPEPKLEPKPEPKLEPRAEPRREATAAAATEAPAEFSGVPRLEMRRERDASGRTSTIIVRVTDAGGRPLPSADVRILRRINGGGIQETRLQSSGGDGSYRAAFPPPTANSDGLSMRVTVGRVSHEVPLAE